MIQEILTYIIVFTATLYTLVSAVKFFLPRKQSGTHCTGCSTGSCGVKNGVLIQMKDQTKISYDVQRVTYKK